MMAFVLTRKAREDLLSIGRYTENKWGKNQRNHYLTMLDRAFLTLAENPSLGRSCDAIKQGYKAYMFSPTILWYTV
jgi:toxin ParE1/3/4